MHPHIHMKVTKSRVKLLFYVWEFESCFFYSEQQIIMHIHFWHFIKDSFSVFYTDFLSEYIYHRSFKSMIYSYCYLFFLLCNSQLIWTAVPSYSAPADTHTQTQTQYWMKKSNTFKISWKLLVFGSVHFTQDSKIKSVLQTLCHRTKTSSWV